MNYRKYVTFMASAAVAATLLISTVAFTTAQETTGLGTYQVLNQYADIQDNGQPVQVFVKGRQLSFQSNARPFIADGVVMVPVVPVLQAELGRCEFNSDQFTAYGAGEPLTGNIGSRIVNGSGLHQFTLPADIQRRNDVVFVPMQFLAVVTGRKLTFDRGSQTMQLGAPNSMPTKP